MYKTIVLLCLMAHIGLNAQDSTILQLEQVITEELGPEFIEKNLELAKELYENQAYQQAIETARKAQLAAIRQNRQEEVAIALNQQAWALSQLNKQKLAFKKLRESQRQMRKNRIDNPTVKSSNKELMFQLMGGKAFKKEFAQVQGLIKNVIDSAKLEISKLDQYAVEVDTDSTSISEAEVEEEALSNELEALNRYLEVNRTTSGERLEVPIADIPELPEVPNQTEIESIVKKSLSRINEKIALEKRKYVEEIELEEEKIEDLDAEEAKEELLFTQYKLKLDSLNNLRIVDSLNLVTAEAKLQKQDSELRRQKTIRSMNIAGATGSFVLISLLLFGYRRQVKNNKLLAEKNQLIRKEQDRSDELLLNILPAEVADELKQHGVAQAHKYDNVSVLFTDFQNFSKIAEQLSPEKLVSELDYCFKSFDNIIGRHQLEKIKTIGDAYMCAGGLPSPDDQNAVHAVEAAMEIQDFLNNWKAQKMAQNEPYFEARIGIHTGPIVAGVVGVKKFAYDIWGDTVNIAARMEAGSEAGKINISGVTYEQVKETFQCNYRGKIHAKNKGEIDMYFVEGQKMQMAL